MLDCFDLHPIQLQICRHFIKVVSIINASNSDNVVAFIAPSTLAFAMAFAVESVAALITIDFKVMYLNMRKAILLANFVVIASSVEAFTVAIAVDSSTFCVNDISLLSCFDVVCVWQCCSLSSSTSFLRLFVAVIFPAGKGKGISKSTEVAE